MGITASFKTKLEQARRLTVGGLVNGTRLSISDLHSPNNEPVHDNADHISAAIQWIHVAQDANKDGGVALGFNVLTQKWMSSYPETTGYIIPTLFDYYHKTQNNNYKNRAIRMCEWELTLQMSDGAFQGGTLDINQKKPTVFNTGQVLMGLCRTAYETKEEKYFIAANKASDWLTTAQDTDGAWRKFASILTSNPINTYNTRTAWALLQADYVLNNEKLRKAAIKNIDWAISQQRPNGWFENAFFNFGEYPILHTIAYTIDGILECGNYLNREDYIQSARKAADALLALQRKDGSLHARYNSKWENVGNWHCLVGEAQISIIWLRLYNITGETKYLDAAKKLNYFLKTTQDLKTSNLGVRGGIKGSSPIYQAYLFFVFPNWAAKFFIDALTLEENLGKSLLMK